MIEVTGAQRVEIENIVAERFQREVVAKALDVADFIVEDLPKDASIEQIFAMIRDVAGLVAKRDTGSRLSVLERALRRFPKHRADTRKEWLGAVAEARAKLEEETREEQKKKAQDPALFPKPRAQIQETAIGYYELSHADGSTERLSDFSLIVLKRVVETEPNKPERLMVRVIDPSGSTIVEKWVVPVASWAGKRAMIASFPSVDMHWYGSDEAIQALGEHLTAGSRETAARIVATEVLGAHEIQGSPRFVLRAGTLGADGQWMAEPDIVYAPAQAAGTLLTLQSPAKDDPFRDEVTQAAREAFALLPQVQEPKVIGALVAMFAAGVARPYLLDKLGGYPICALAAEAGAGKSSLIGRVLWPMFAGIRQGVGTLSATQTPFAMLRDLSSTNAIPLVFDELKLSEMHHTINYFLRLMKRSWNGDVETRGNADKSTTSYTIAAPVILSGESRFDIDSAVAERCAFISLDRGWLFAHPFARERFNELGFNVPHLSDVGRRFQAFSLGVARDELLADAAGEVAALLVSPDVPAEIPPRLITTLTVAAFGLRLARAFAASCGAYLALAPFAAVGRYLLEEALGVADEDDDASEAAKSAIGESVSRDALDMAMVDYAHLAMAGRLSEGMHYTWVDGDLMLWLEGAEGERERWFAERRTANTSPGVRELKRIAKRKLGEWRRTSAGYVLGASKQVVLEGDRRPRCIRVRPALFPSSLGVGDFPCSKVRTWGGAGRFEGHSLWEVASERAGQRKN